MSVDPYAGRTLGPFRIGAKLGKGGMGAVYRATHSTLDREVALKILPEPPAEETGDFEARFLREARSAAKINHPNIVQVYDAGDAGGATFISMELIDGPSLRELQAGVGQFTALQAVEITLQAAMGLEAAFDKGIVHGDVKPDNLLFTLRGEVKVSDFGLAQMHGAAKNPGDEDFFAGTPAYMSPEQGVGENTDFRSDIYSLGVTLFEMVTGRKPFSAPSSVGLLVMHFSAPVPNPGSLRPDLPPEFCAVNVKMMDKDPEQRFRSYEELVDALSALKERLEADSRADYRGSKSKTLMDFLSELEQDRKVLETAQDDDTRRLPNPPIPSELKPALLRLTKGKKTPHPQKAPPATPSMAMHKHAHRWWFYPAGAAVLFLVGIALIWFAVYGSDALRPGTARQDGNAARSSSADGSGSRHPPVPPIEPAGPAPGAKAPKNPKPALPGGTALPGGFEKDKQKLYGILHDAESLEEAGKYEQALARLASVIPEGLGDQGEENLRARLAVGEAQVKLKLAGLEEREGEVRKALELAKGCWLLRDSFPRLKAYIERLKAKLDILTLYPPGDRWNPDRRREIMMKVLYGKEVTDQERQFYLRFPEWERSLDPAGCGLDSKASSEDLPEVLRKFPPGRDWNAKRRQQIVRKMLTPDGPTEEEREFYLRYKEWEKALAGLANLDD